MSDAMQLPSSFLGDRTQIQRAAGTAENAATLGRRTAGVGQARLREVAEEFESLFLKEMLDSMRNTLNEENRLVDTGMAGEYFEDMLYEEYSKIMAKRGTFGIAELIVDQFRDSAPS
ncbi:MAG: rod-binding protein [Alkalispirochaetaceae bacterium]